jgi:stage IV sporulation protein FB
VLAEPERTQYDLRFRFLGFPVRVHPYFWFLGVLLGYPYARMGGEYVLIWVAVVFVSILVHELGHAIAFRRFGADADIVLYAFGGLAIPSHDISGRWRRIMVSLAGPFAGFILCGLVYGTNKAFEWAEQSNGLPANGPHLWVFYISLVFVNLWWGVFNLLPVYPLDGGQVCRELCVMKWGTRGKRTSLRISFIVALLLVGYALLCEIDTGQFGAGLTKDLPSWVPRGTIFTALLFGFLAYDSYRLLQRTEWTDTHWDDRTPFEK